MAKENVGKMQPVKCYSFFETYTFSWQRCLFIVVFVIVGGGDGGGGDDGFGCGICLISEIVKIDTSGPMTLLPWWPIRRPFCPYVV